MAGSLFAWHVKLPLKNGERVLVCYGHYRAGRLCWVSKLSSKHSSKSKFQVIAPLTSDVLHLDKGAKSP